MRALVFELTCSYANCDNAADYMVSQVNSEIKKSENQIYFPVCKTCEPLWWEGTSKDIKDFEPVRVVVKSEAVSRRDVCAL